MDAPTSAAAWLALMLEGSVGALIALGGVVWALHRQLRADRDTDDRRRAAEDSRAREQRTAESTATVLTKLTGIPLGLRRFEEQQEWVDQVQQALLVFSALERADHPHIADWALATSARLATTFEREKQATAAWEAAGRQGQMPQSEMGAIAGEATAALSMWHAGAARDDWFRDRGYKRTPEGRIEVS